MRELLFRQSMSLGKVFFTRRCTAILSSAAFFVEVHVSSLSLLSSRLSKPDEDIISIFKLFAFFNLYVLFKEANPSTKKLFV
jgi:hypothetical protein